MVLDLRLLLRLGVVRVSGHVGRLRVDVLRRLSVSRRHAAIGGAR